MTSDRWRRIDEIYREARARHGRARDEYLRSACGADSVLRAEIEARLASSRSPSGSDADGSRGSRPARGASDLGAASGRRIGGYEAQGLIGAGGMGEVYRARDLRLGRDVAIKILPGAFTADFDRLARFEREARMLATVNHPNIAVIHGFEESDGLCALVMELIEGETLAERLAHHQRGRSGVSALVPGGLPIKDALAIARQIADALDAAHEKGIIHRDLKPANVKITPQGVVKVLDFGLAKEIPDTGTPRDVTHSPTMTVGATFEGVILGTAPYMSPEQARGKPVDKRADVWAFGCVLYEMLTGHPPFMGETVSDIIVGILEHEPDWNALPPNTPANLVQLLHHCLQKGVHGRLRDIGDARLVIDDVLRDGSASSLQSMPITRALHPPRTVPPWTIGAVLAALVAISAAVAGILGWPSRGPVITPTLARLMITMPADQTIERGRYPPVALSPDGKLLVYAATMNGGRTGLFIRPLDQLEARSIPATDGASTPFFSPDGRWLGFYADGELKKVPVAGGVPLTICPAPPVWSAFWGAGDRIVFATTQASSGLWLVSANGGEPMPVTTPMPEDAQHGYPQILPDGDRVLFSVRRKNAWYLALTTVSGGAWTLLGNGRVIGEGAQYLPTGHLVYAQGGGLVATPFNPAAGVLDQPPVPLLERIETSRFGGAYFAFAPQAGTLVYLPVNTAVVDRTLMKVDRNGRATPAIETRGSYESPVLSPDGRQVAVMIVSETGSDVWLIDLERATRIRFTSGGTSAFPVWGPDGSKMAFQSTAPGMMNLFWKPLNGGAEPQPLLGSSGASSANAGADLLPGTLPTLSGAGPQFPTSWAPDGTLAFHERKPSGERDIWVVPPGGEATPFLLTSFDERSPRFSPDGKWLAYVSDEAGRNDVYVQPFPGPGPKWLVSPDGGIDPVWSSDGRELFYRQGDQLMAASVARSGEFLASRPTRLFEFRFDPGDNGSSYDVSRDGQWFLMARSDRGPVSGELHLVLNWFEEVKARVKENARDRGRVPDSVTALRRSGP
jgi:eukaryotic-like serine/threonine-protein kinase